MIYIFLNSILRERKQQQLPFLLVIHSYTTTTPAHPPGHKSTLASEERLSFSFFRIFDTKKKKILVNHVELEHHHTREKGNGVL